MEKNFKSLLSFVNEDEKLEHDANMLSLNFISQINKVMIANNLTKEQLAKDLGVTNSYINQIFSGEKIASFLFLAKIENKLGIKFNIEVTT